MSGLVCPSHTLHGRSFTKVTSLIRLSVCITCSPFVSMAGTLRRCHWHTGRSERAAAHRE